MKFSKKLLYFLVLSLLTSFTGMVRPAQSQEPEQPKLVVFESVGSIQ